jgi:hypothetical protein
MLEPLRGADLRSAIRAIIHRDLNPEPPVTPPQISNRLKNTHLAPERKARIRSAIRAANKQRRLNRPEGCVYLRQAAERGKITPRHMATVIKRLGITCQSHDGTYAWYRVADLIAAGLLPESS